MEFVNYKETKMRSRITIIYLQGNLYSNDIFKN